VPVEPLFDPPLGAIRVFLDRTPHVVQKPLMGEPLFLKQRHEGRLRRRHSFLDVRRSAGDIPASARRGGHTEPFEALFDQRLMILDQGLPTGRPGRDLGSCTMPFGGDQFVRGELDGIQGHGGLRGPGDPRGGDLLELPNLHPHFFRGALGKVARRAHQRRDGKKGRRQFQTNPHCDLPFA
jgi:hypothetical protein